jgi:hypothetical protein
VPLFADSRKRLDRAVKHAETFRTIWEASVDPVSHQTVMEMNSDWTEGVARYVHAPLPENELSLELGEMFYQLRAALDGVIYKAAVIAEGIDPPSNANRVEFPICIDLAKFSRNTINDPPFPNNLRDWVETIQPYNASKTAGTDLHFVNTCLKLLHDCARKDRHRKLHLVAAVPTYINYRLEMWPGRLVFAEPLVCNLFEDKNEFLKFRTTGFTSNGGKIKLNSDVMIELSIEEIPLLNLGNSAAVINSIFSAVDVVIAYFENWYK